MALAQRVNNCCYRCTERKIGCHSNCEKYKAFVEDKKAQNKYMWDNVYSYNVYAGRIIKRSLKNKKNHR